MNIDVCNLSQKSVSSKDSPTTALNFLQFCSFLSLLPAFAIPICSHSRKSFDVSFVRGWRRMILIREKVWRPCPTSSLPNCNSGSSNGTSSQVHHHRFFTESITGAKGPPGMHTRRRTSADKAPNTEGKCHKPATSSITPELCCISPGTITTLMIRKSNKERMKNGNMSICVGEDAQKAHLQRSKPSWTILMEWSNLLPIYINDLLASAHAAKPELWPDEEGANAHRKESRPPSLKLQNHKMSGTQALLQPCCKSALVADLRKLADLQTDTHTEREGGNKFLSKPQNVPMRRSEF